MFRLVRPRRRARQLRPRGVRWRRSAACANGPCQPRRRHQLHDSRYGDTSPTTQATSLRATVIADDESGVSSSDVRFQIFHAAPRIEEGDVYSLNSVGGVDTNLVRDLGFGGFGSAPDLPKAPYDVAFEANSSGLIIADFTVPALTVEAASVFIIQDSADAVYLLAQLVGTSTALICENSATGPCEL